MAATQVTEDQCVELQTAPGFKLRADAAAAWDQACNAAGLFPVPSGTWRSFQRQLEMFTDRYVYGDHRGQTGYANDYRTWSNPPAGYKAGGYTRKASESAAAVPGTSNHGGGLAVDVRTSRAADTPPKPHVVFTGFKDADRLAWLAAAKPYGWADDEGRSVDEPWHVTYYPARDTATKLAMGWPVLKQGAKSAAVGELQTWLNNHGYVCGIDNSFGPETTSRVKEYQSLRGLTVDGAVGPATQADMAANTDTVTPPSSGGRLNGIDISHWQSDDKATLAGAEFVILKATDGNSYVDATFTAKLAKAKAAGRLVGAYHFAQAGTNSATAEADHFLSVVGPYLGDLLLVLDWEAKALDSGPAWALAFCNRVQEKTGITPLIYGSRGNVCLAKYADVAARFPLWVAAYGSNNGPGFDTSREPGNVAPWSHATIYQYASNSQAYGSLDLDWFAGTRQDWLKLAAPAGTTAPEQPEPPTEPEVPETPGKLKVDGLWGTATTKALQAAFGLPVTGTITGQPIANRDALTQAGHKLGLTSGWQWSDTASRDVAGQSGDPTIIKLQKYLAANIAYTGPVDGFFGPETVTALQTFLDCTQIDGQISHPSNVVKALQTSLNDGTFY